MLDTKSKQLALLAAHVYNVTHAFCLMSFSTKLMSRTKIDLKLSIPAVKNRRKSLSLSCVRYGNKSIYKFL